MMSICGDEQHYYFRHEPSGCLLTLVYYGGDDVAQYVYGVEIPLADGYTWFELVRCEEPAHAAEVIRVLLSSTARCPTKLQVVVHPVVPPADVVAGQ